MVEPRSNSLPDNYNFPANNLDLNGIRMHYIDEGSGHPVLMLHGNPTWSYYYRNLVHYLEKNHRCIALDHIGCGLSDKPQDYPYTLKTHIDNCEALVDSLELKSFDLVVHDWGGAIGMGLAVRNPERIRRIVIMNSAAFRSKRIPLRIAVCRIPILGKFMVRRLNLFLLASRYMATSSFPGLNGKTWEGYLYPYDTYENRIAIHNFVMDIPLDPRDQSYSVLEENEEKLSSLSDKKTLFLWGMKDFCFTPVFLEKWKKIFPHAASIEFPAASHFILEDEPRKTSKAISDFLE